MLGTVIQALMLKQTDYFILLEQLNMVPKRCQCLVRSSSRSGLEQLTRLLVVPTKRLYSRSERHDYKC